MKNMKKKRENMRMWIYKQYKESNAERVFRVIYNVMFVIAMALSGIAFGLGLYMVFGKK
jgi:magnesium-transporting ATPase (P-type)